MAYPTSCAYRQCFAFVFIFCFFFFVFFFFFGFLFFCFFVVCFVSCFGFFWFFLFFLFFLFFFVFRGLAHILVGFDSLLWPAFFGGVGIQEGGRTAMGLGLGSRKTEQNRVKTRKNSKKKAKKDNLTAL